MRIALVLTSSYAHRPDLGTHSAAAHDAKLVRDKLTQKGFEFAVVDVPLTSDADERVGQVLREHKAGPDDVVVTYVSGYAHLDDAGEISLEADEGDESGRRRMSLARLRTALNGSGVRGAAVVMDLVYQGTADCARGARTTSRRSEGSLRLSCRGYSMLCAVRSKEQEPGRSRRICVHLAVPSYARQAGISQCRSFGRRVEGRRAAARRS